MRERERERKNKREKRQRWTEKAEKIENYKQVSNSIYKRVMIVLMSNTAVLLLHVKVKLT